MLDIPIKLKSRFVLRIGNRRAGNHHLYATRGKTHNLVESGYL